MGELFLKKAGLDRNADVQYISLGGDPGVICTALKTGKVDVFTAWEPTTTRVIAENIAYALISIWRPEVHAQWIGKRALCMLLVAREDEVARNPGIVRRVNRGAPHGPGVYPPAQL